MQFWWHLAQVVAKRHDGLHGGHNAAPALFAGGNHNILPALHAFFGALAAEPHHAAFADNGLDGAHAQFHAFLQGEIHALAAGNGLDKGDLEPAFVFRLPLRGDVALSVAFADFLQGGIKIVACAVKQRDAIACVKAQNVDVAHDVFRQPESGVGGEVGGQIEAWHGVENVRIC